MPGEVIAQRRKGKHREALVNREPEGMQGAKNGQATGGRKRQQKIHRSGTPSAELGEDEGHEGQDKVTGKNEQASSNFWVVGELGRGSFYEARSGPTLPTRIRRKVAR